MAIITLELTEDQARELLELLQAEAQPKYGYEDKRWGEIIDRLQQSIEDDTQEAEPA